jgi:hypothetical protein
MTTPDAVPTAVVSTDTAAVPTAEELGATAARLGYPLDADQIAEMHAAGLAAAPAFTRLRDRLPSANDAAAGGRRAHRAAGPRVGTGAGGRPAGGGVRRVVSGRLKACSECVTRSTRAVRAC